MKGLLKFITCGSVDDGKSTLIGHILYDSKLLYADQEKALELDSRVGSRSGKIDYSLLLDGLMAEREQGITIDVAYRYFTTDNRSFIVADTPGHEEYTRNMAVGASFADLAVILVDASQGVLVQTKRHARICSLMGIGHFVFAVNKMDLVDYSQSRFNEITEQIEVLKNNLGLKNIAIIPVSATEGDNVTTLSPNMPWYKGKNLLEHLETVDTDAVSEEGFYMPIQRVCRPDRTFRGFQGQIEAGGLKVGDEVTAIPSGEKVHIKEIFITDRKSEKAHTGQPVTITLDKEVDVSRGCVFIKNNSIAAYKKINALLLWTDDSPVTAGRDYLIKLGTKNISGILSKILYRVDVNTGEQSPAEALSKNEIAMCEIIFSEAIAADKFSEHKTLGELILIDRLTNMTSACGVVTELSEKDVDKLNKALFRLENITARGEIFDEFVYDINALNVLKYQTVNGTFTVGDEIPLTGKSYSYPDSFDIIILRDNTAVKVRGKKVTEIISVADYKYSGLPVLNGRGFAVKVNSQSETESFLTEYRSADDKSDFYAKWTVFDVYRKIPLK